MVKKKTKPDKGAKKREGGWAEEEVQVHTVLPPQVEGQLRCFCKVSIDQILWQISSPPQSMQCRIRWWGETGPGTSFKPHDVKQAKKDTPTRHTARYEVRSGLQQFATYLSDMSTLTVEVVAGLADAVIGRVEIPQIAQLSINRPINGFFPVMSTRQEKIAELHVSVVLEPLMASYDSMGSIPTTDISVNTSATQDSTFPNRVEPKPHPQQPVRPEEDPFISPASQKTAEPKRNQSGPYAEELRQRLTYDPQEATQQSRQGRQNGQAVVITAGGDILTTHPHPAPPPEAGSKAATAGGDLLSLLVERGNKLREAMIVSTMHSQDSALSHPQDIPLPPSSLPPSTRSSASGGLLKEILRAEKGVGEVAMVTDDRAAADKGALDLMLQSPVRKQDYQLYRLINNGSPGESLSSDAIDLEFDSEPGSPTKEDSLLHDLFYKHTDTEMSGLSDLSGDELRSRRSTARSARGLPPRPKSGTTDTPSEVLSMEDPSNSRPSSRRSSVSSLTAFPETKRKPKRPATPTKKSSKTPRKSSRTRRRSQSKSRSRSRSKTRGQSNSTASEASDAETARSETSRVSFDMGPSDVDEPVRDSGPASARTDELSVERLTLLGRVHVARVTVDTVHLRHAESDSGTRKLDRSGRLGKPPRPVLKAKKPCTYFLEYQFPVVAVSRDKCSPNAMATEEIRVASKNVRDGVVTFNHRSVFPVMFDGSTVEKWWKSALVFKVYAREATEKLPTLIGSCGIPLKAVLRSADLNLEKRLEVRSGQKLNSSFNSSHSRSSPRSTLIGHLLMGVQLASDHKEFAKALARTKMAELAGTTRRVPIAPDPAAAKPPVPPKLPRQEPEYQSYSQSSQTAMQREADFSQPSHAPVPSVSPRPGYVPAPSSFPPAPTPPTGPIGSIQQQLVPLMPARNSEVLTLHTMLYIPEGRNINLQGVPPLHAVNKRPMLLHQQTHPPAGVRVRDSVTRNCYLVCKMFWCADSVRSDICWGTFQPQFNFLQVAPVQITSALLERMRNNFMVVEVWDKKTSAETDKLIGIVKLSLHQFFMSFREYKIAEALLKTQYPVIGIDTHAPIVDLFSGFQFGQLKVLLAMGSAEQISNLQKVKLFNEASSAIPERPLHFLERQDLVEQKNSHLQGSHSVEHVFEVVVEGIRGLPQFESMIWGEADCFIQYHFPSQGRENLQPGHVLHALPTLRMFRTATTLCVPDPAFHHVTRHRITLPPGTPVQRELLSACANSSGGSGGLPFEVWCRFYHPNVRDQVMARATLPLAKLCAMVTMQKQGENSVQSFALTLSGVAVEDRGSGSEPKIKESGLIDLTVHYKSQTVATPAELSHSNSRLNVTGSQVCLSLGILRATGLRAAAEAAAKLDSSLKYPSEVGVNSYVKIQLSFLGPEDERVTKTVARTFAPEYSHFLDFPCPVLWNKADSDALSLAEILETAQVTLQIFHQVPVSADDLSSQYVEKGGEEVSGRCLVRRKGDVLLGTVTVPLACLLSQRTGMTGWFPVKLPALGWQRAEEEEGETSGQGLPGVGGGLELSLRFAHQEDRTRVLQAGRSVGWTPADLLVDDPDWVEEDCEGKHQRVTISVDQVCVPLTAAMMAGQNQLDPGTRCYIRYKFYDKAAVASRLFVVEQNDRGYVMVLPRHKHTIVVPKCPTFQWYLREEKLEMQVWLAYGCRQKSSHSRPRPRDRLVGTAYVDLHDLAAPHRSQHRVSGCHPLFKPGAATLGGAYLRCHVTIRLHAKGSQFSSDEEEEGMVNAWSSGEDSEQENTLDYDVEHILARHQSPHKSRRSASPSSSFAVHIAIERAMHLPLVNDKDRVGQREPCAYVSFQTAEKAGPTFTSVHPASTSPVWEFDLETRLSTELLEKGSKNLIFKVWHKPPEAPPKPDKSSDRVLGFVSVDLAPLTSGLQQLCGWYNILDFYGQCRGQIKVNISPQESLSGTPPLSARSMPAEPSAVSSSQPSFGLGAASAAFSGLATFPPDLHRRIQACLAAGSAALAPSPSGATPTPTQHWQPPSLPQTGTPDLQDASKSFLFSSLRQQLNDLDSITQKLKTRLVVGGGDVNASNDSAHNQSGAQLTGTHSGLSTISSPHSTLGHPAAAMDVVQEQSSSTRHGDSTHTAADSGAFSVSSDKTPDALDSHRSDKTVGFNLTPREITLRDLEASYGNLEGLPPTPRQAPPEASARSEPYSGMSEVSQGFTPGQYTPSETSGRMSSEVRRSQQHFLSIYEQGEDDVENFQHLGDFDSNSEEEDEKFGSYHHYRALLDEKEAERDGMREEDADDEEDEGTVVKPRALNEVTSTFSLKRINDDEDDDDDDDDDEEEGMARTAPALTPRTPRTPRTPHTPRQTWPPPSGSPSIYGHSPVNGLSPPAKQGGSPGQGVSGTRRYLEESMEQEEEPEVLNRPESRGKLHEPELTRSRRRAEEEEEEEEQLRSTSQSRTEPSAPVHRHLLSKVELIDTLNSDFGATSEDPAPRARPHPQPSPPPHNHLLSNVDLESVGSGISAHPSESSTSGFSAVSANHPDSVSSKFSRQSSHSGSYDHPAHITEEEEDLEDGEEGERVLTSTKEVAQTPRTPRTPRDPLLTMKPAELDAFFERQQEGLPSLAESVSAESVRLNLSETLRLTPRQLDAFARHDYSRVVGHVQEEVAEVPESTELHSDRTTEDSGVESGTKSSQEEKDSSHGVLPLRERRKRLPNFFPPEHKLAATMHAVGSAASEAARLPPHPRTCHDFEDPERTQARTKAVSDMAQKLLHGTRVKFASTTPAPMSVTAKLRQPPSAEEQRRIARIFNTKLT